MRCYRLKLDARFDVSLYGVDGAKVCATYWVKKMIFFFEHFRAAGSPLPYEFPADVALSFVEPAAFAALTDTVRAPRAVTRYIALRAMAPVGNGVLA